MPSAIGNYSATVPSLRWNSLHSTCLSTVICYNANIPRQFYNLGQKGKNKKEVKMRFDQRIVRPNSVVVVLRTILGALCGCAVVGPTSISMGRADYNEAINKTDDAQMLMSIVRGRYGETFSLLAVTGVAANVRFGTNAGVNVGFGPDENFAGNLVPFSGGLAYEENPTITYAPVQGAQYVRQLLSPIPLDILLLLVRAMPEPGQIITLLVKKNQRPAKP
jgi:hypothetical protein